MHKITIISYYELKESLELAANALSNIGYIVNNYPLFKYVYDVNDKLYNYKDHFNNFLQNEKPDIILWWFINIPTDIFAYICKNNTALHVLYNWDDPWSWQVESLDLKGKSKYLDLATGTCEETLQDYLKYGAKNAIYLHPGFDPKIHYPFSSEESNEYKCDISICCTNLYGEDIYNDQYIRRKDLIDKIYEESNLLNIKFHIYGPEYLQKIYPNSYRGFIKYYDISKVISNSKINLCTHVCSSKSKYMNERCSIILGCGGLLLVDKVKDLDKLIIPNKECIVMENSIINIIMQIKNILANYDDKYEIRKNALLRSKDYTWETWALKLHKKISEIHTYKKIKIDDKINKETLFKLKSKFVNLDQSNKYDDIYKQLYAIEKICIENPYMNINEELNKFIAETE